MMQLAEATGRGMQRGKKERRLWNFRAERKTSGAKSFGLFGEEVPKCIGEPLFALLPKDTDTECHHLSQGSRLLRWVSVSLSVPCLLHRAQATCIVSTDQAKLVCKPSLSEIKTQLRPYEWRTKTVLRLEHRALKTGSNSTLRSTSLMCFQLYSAADIFTSRWNVTLKYYVLSWWIFWVTSFCVHSYDVPVTVFAPAHLYFTATLANGDMHVFSLFQ